MTQTHTRDPSAHDFDKHNWDKHNSDQHKWDENALGNSEAVVKKTQRQNNPPSDMRYKKIRHKKNRLNSKSGD
ncbi:hypothetical protein A9299_00225 [Moraxella osloensis]|uniref:Uncharacterized protein n=1 Tax=Faucicola osloensis TaxID=34062 RepID=A0AA91FN72_FAUOS|nr:hypothetical protein A9299_00225 [Moraxella osloensis]